MSKKNNQYKPVNLNIRPSLPKVNSFKTIKPPSMKGTGKSLAKCAAVYYAAHRLGKAIDRNREIVESEKKQAEQENNKTRIEVPLYDEGVVKIIRVISGLLEAIVINGVAIDPELMQQSKKVLDQMQTIYDYIKEENGNQAEQKIDKTRLEFIVYDTGVVKIIRVISNLLEAIVINGVTIDPELMQQSKKVLDRMQTVYNYIKEENGN
jgi:D-ribose pyranose/furanose isomerase RbsD